jgi:hypothetical protein
MPKLGDYLANWRRAFGGSSDSAPPGAEASAPANPRRRAANYGRDVDLPSLSAEEAAAVAGWRQQGYPEDQIPELLRRRRAATLGGMRGRP